LKTGAGAARPGVAIPLALALALAPFPGLAARPDARDAASRLDPRLAGLTRVPAEIAVWVTFADKGERGPADLAARLAEADAALSPRNRARRGRAGLSPRVTYRDLPVEPRYLDDLARRGLVPYGVSRWGNEAAVRAPGTRLEELAALPQVARLRPVERARAARPEGPGPERVRRPMGTRAAAAGVIDHGQTLPMLSQIALPAVHDSGYTGAGVLVCVLDNGFNHHDTHEALREALVPPGHRRDFVEGDSVVVDTTGAPFPAFLHGTWALGCIAGNAPGVYVGAAPGATFALGRTEYDATETPVELVWWRMGAEWADSLGADVLSSSLGYAQFDDPADDITYAMLDGHTSPVTRAAEIAASVGILVVNAVGNSGAGSTIWAPSDVNGDSLVAVGAVDANGTIASFSSRGPTVDGRVKPDLVARGVNVPLVSASGDPQAYTVQNGTSFSTPLVAGLAACLLQARPAWSAVQVIEALYATASRSQRPDPAYGRGLPSGLTALQWVPGTPRGPEALVLVPAGPNPYTRGGPPAAVRVTLSAAAPPSSPGSVRLVDATGRRVRTLWSGTLERGAWITATWDGRDGDGRDARPGIYFVVAQAAGRARTLRLAWLR
jgi:subtilisin family serine protease